MVSAHRKIVSSWRSDEAESKIERFQSSLSFTGYAVGETDEPISLSWAGNTVYETDEPAFRPLFENMVCETDEPFCRNGKTPEELSVLSFLNDD